ncbi:MAG TPA: phosphoenolpyruvate synthase [Candidatus Magasanikbacteria bacterium]|nr:phosphoenolpyruvate synthase [Candidatus Magasanikbacteria bacterium]
MTPKENTSSKQKKHILWFNEIGITDVPLVGGKNASLGEMYSNLTKKGIDVPNGFAITAAAYWDFVEQSKIKHKIKEAVRDLDVTDVKKLAQVGKKVRNIILNAHFSKELEKEIEKAYIELSKFEKTQNVAVAVRSSATAEDLPDASFAGQQETYLNVKGIKGLQTAVKKCVASLFTDRAISYRETKGFDHLSVALSVAVQTMVRSDLGSSGVMFTLDTESGFPGVVLINASYGLGEYVVKGRVTPDQFYIFKEGIKQNKKAIISRIIGTKEVKLVYGNTSGTKQLSVAKKDQNAFAISDSDVLQLAKWGVEIENYYKRPQDIEWAKDGKTGKLYIVQARPVTVKAHVSTSVIETYILKKKGKVLLNGTAVGQKIGAGKVRVIDNPKQMREFKKGEVLVTRITDPDWEPIMRIASAIVTEQGGKTSHAAIVSRELGVPCLVGAKNARKVLKTGKLVTVSCAEGDTGVIYNTVLPFEVKKTEIKNIEKTKTKIMMNVGDPDNAFPLSFLPHDGVGLAREEFIFTNFIRIHPLALVHYDKLKDKKAKRKIAELTRGYNNKTSYGVDKLAEGIGRIATAFYPHDVIVRLSDFKTNEYATLIGGKEFEPKEENPMLGWRGASRYYSKEYKPGFKLECEALKKVREEWGLRNVVVMVPFCRTPEEGEQVLNTMKEYGLERGKEDLRVYVMCEIPSNVILAEDFAKLFDGFSIGSNDLTQLTLGVDRDSALVSHVYSEKNKAVTDLIKNVIRVAHANKRKVGICGQAPSDYPEFAEMLVREGIDSISLNPDTVVSTRERIAYVEKTLGKRGKKTHKPYLMMVAAFAVLAGGLMMVGGGCDSIRGDLPMSQPDLLDVSPAEIRARVEDRMSQARDREKELPTQELRVDSFASFSIKYPETWSVSYWNGGVSIENKETKEYISIFEQLVGHPVALENKKAIQIGPYSGYQYTENYKGTEDGEYEVVELQYGDAILEINGKAGKFDDILNTLQFVESSSANGPLTHWDVRERRVCVQMITYAREGGVGACQAFPTPCEVPEGWTVCDASDL